MLSKIRRIKIYIILIIFICIIYILISVVEDPSDFNKIIHPTRLKFIESEVGVEHYNKYLLPTIEQYYQNDIIARRKTDFIENAPSSFETTNSDFWSYFPAIPSWCPHTVERVGGILWNWRWRGEGGKWICGLDRLKTPEDNNPCLVYSYGVEDDTSFELAMLQRTNCSIFLFDPTVDGSSASIQSLLVNYPSRIHFEKIGLDYTNYNDTGKGYQYRTLKSEMLLRHHHFIDILKVDIEGQEFETFRNIIKDFAHKNSELPIGQLQIEIHLPNLNRGENLERWLLFQGWYEGLEAAGLRAFHSEPNPMSATKPNDHVKYYEYSFLNIRSKQLILNGYELPAFSSGKII